MSVTAFKLNHVESIADKMKRLRGEAYPVGIRQAAKHIGPTLSGTRLNVSSLLGREF